MRFAWPACPHDRGPLRPNEDLDLACTICGRVWYRQPIEMPAGSKP